MVHFLRLSGFSYDSHGVMWQNGEWKYGRLACVFWMKLVRCKYSVLASDMHKFLHYLVINAAINRICRKDTNIIANKVIPLLRRIRLLSLRKVCHCLRRLLNQILKV